MRHLLTMFLFAGLVALVFSGVAPAETTWERVKLGLRTWCEFVLVGLLLAWVVYFFPWGG